MTSDRQLKASREDSKERVVCERNRDPGRTRTPSVWDHAGLVIHKLSSTSAGAAETTTNPHNYTKSTSRIHPEGWQWEGNLVRAHPICFHARDHLLGLHHRPCVCADHLVQYFYFYWSSPESDDLWYTTGFSNKRICALSVVPASCS